MISLFEFNLSKFRQKDFIQDLSYLEIKDAQEQYKLIGEFQEILSKITLVKELFAYAAFLTMIS